jgi:phosphoglycerate kinase
LEEEKNEAGFAQGLAKLADVYVNDAFAVSHRAHASTEGMTRYVKTVAAGFLMMKEVESLEKALMHPEKPYVAIMGGAKVSDKIGVIQNLLDKVNTLLVGGGMAYTFLKAKGFDVGKSLVEIDQISFSLQLVVESGHLPVDGQGRADGSLRSVLQSDRCSEERHDAARQKEQE